MIRMQNVEKNYGKYHLNLTLSIPEGCVSGLVGRNGAGKSTVIKLILGLIHSDAGTITVNGRNVSEMRAKDKEIFGAALAESSFSKEFTPDDIRSILKRMYKNFDEEWYLDQCQKLGVPLKKKTAEFSTGMKAKLRILVAMSHKSPLLILDEPTAGLDIQARGEVIDLLREYIQEDDKRSILITSHISSDLEGICDDIYLIHDGKLILHEETDVILDNYAILKVDESMYQKLDQQYILRAEKEHFGYCCFTNQKQFYQENYPGIVIENGGIDDLILMMTREVVL